MLEIFGPDGLETRIEQFDVGHETEALARFDELGQEGFGVEPSKQIPLSPPFPKFPKGQAGTEAGIAAVRRRVRLNAATAHINRLDAAIAARNAEAVPNLFADDAGAMDHITHTAWDRAALLSAWRSLALAQDPTCRHEPLATLGDSLALCRVSLGASGLARGGFDVGAYEKTEIHLIEADVQGRRRWTEVFATERLGDAVARLYARCAELLPAGPGRTRAAATARSVAAHAGPLDLDCLARAVAPAAELVDHRTLVTWSGRGAEAVLQHWRAWLVLVDVTVRFDDILGLRPDALLCRHTFFGTERAGGGSWEIQTLSLWAFGADGLFTSAELFDGGRETEALARFDEPFNPSVSPLGRAKIEEESSPAARFENAATRTRERVNETWQARDWEGYAALHAPEFQCFDRRKQMHIELDRNQYLDSYRSWFQMRSSVLRTEVLATRGRRLAIIRVGWEGADDLVGPSEVEFLQLIEVNDAGQRVAIVNFDPDDLDAAYAELDRCYDAGEGAVLGGAFTRYARSFANRDWEGVAALCAPTFVEHDHRRITGIGTTRGADVWVENNVRVWIDLAPNIVTRFTHIRGHGRGSLWQISLQGSREGGRFEIAFAGVTALDEECRIERVDIYDFDQLAEALARFDELVNPSVSPLGKGRIEEGSPRAVVRRVRPNAATANSAASTPRSLPEMRTRSPG